MNFARTIDRGSSRRGSKPAGLRILVMSHSHPKVTSGGAEISAYRLFTELNTRENIDAWFLGCDAKSGGARDGVAITQPFTDREYIYSPGVSFDWFRLGNADPRLPAELETLLLELKPDIVHLHHYVVYGVEVIWTIRRVLPAACIIVTLHEYIAICNHFGQMVKTTSFNLCDDGSLQSCHRCFPSIAIADFFMRSRYIKLFFEVVNHFVSPSRFLMDRYVDWGIEQERISVIENIVSLPDDAAAAASEAAEVTGVLRIGFFGQISRLKGISVLLECASILSDHATARISFEIYGDYSNQPKEFQEEFQKQMATLRSNVIYRGAYRQDQVDRLMRGVDVVLVPSIWWENSPVVIQEALRNSRPVICSNIGGMAEKVRDGKDGFHFPVGSSLALSYLLLRLHDDASALAAVRQTLKSPASVKDVVEGHIALYTSAYTKSKQRM